MSDRKMTEGPSKSDEQPVKRPMKVKKKGVAAKLAERKRKNGSQVSLQGQHENKPSGKIGGKSEKLESDISPRASKDNIKQIYSSAKQNQDEKVIHVSTKERRIFSRERQGEKRSNYEHLKSDGKPMPKPRHCNEDVRPKNPEPMDLDEGFITGTANGQTDEANTSPTDATLHRFRNLRMTNQRSNSVESLKNLPFMPKPPTTPRKSPPKRSHDNTSSGEELDHENKKSPHYPTYKRDSSIGSHPSPRLKLLESKMDNVNSALLKTPVINTRDRSQSHENLKTIDGVSNNELTIGSGSDIRELTENYNKILNDNLLDTHTPRSVSDDRLSKYQSQMLISPSKCPPSPRLAPLAPITPLKHPPPLPGEFSSSALRTSYKTEKVVPSKLFERSDSAPQVLTDAMSQKSYGSASGRPILTTKEARSRSLSDAGAHASSTLMGADELERYFPDRQIHVWIGSWNMKEIKSITSSMTDFLLPESCKYVQNMYVVGTQENAMNKKEWEIHLQEILGSTFVLFHSVSHGSLHLAVFIHRDLIWFCTVPEEDMVSTRAVTMVKTKGAIAISLSFFGTSMMFINCHLTSDQSKKKNRILDYQKIITGLKLPKSSSSPYQDVTSNFDCVFWCGDLNFRIERRKEAVEGKVTEITENDFPNYETLLRSDQLNKILTEGKIFQGFQEGRINFRPTYKYDVNTDQYDTSNKMRIPSYTDRILFRSKKRNHISCLHYNSVMSVCMSDHKPVYGIYQMAVKPGKDFITSAAGHFDKEVYLKANRRRALRQSNIEIKNQKMSTICSIQ